jgi:hypothetical protein
MEGACKNPEIVLEIKIHEKLIRAFKVQFLKKKLGERL